MKCNHCEYDGPPTEKPPMIIVCPKCKNSYDYFQTSEYFNNQKKARLAKSRAEANEKVKRSYRLKGK